MHVLFLVVRNMNCDRYCLFFASLSFTMKLEFVLLDWEVQVINMRMDQLNCLVDIAQTGSLTSTAKRLFVSQQAVSKSIKQLEEELGVTILIRTKTGVTFTEDGIAVVEFARKVLAEQDNLLQNFVHFLTQDVTMAPYTMAVRKDQKAMAQFFPGRENSPSLRAWLGD